MNKGDSEAGKLLIESRLHLEIVVWIYDTFDNNLGVKNDLIK